MKIKKNKIYSLLFVFVCSLIWSSYVCNAMNVDCATVQKAKIESKLSKKYRLFLPVISPEDEDLDKIRVSLDEAITYDAAKFRKLSEEVAKEIKATDPDIETILLPSNSYYGVCFNYVASTLLGIAGKVSEVFDHKLIAGADWFERNEIDFLQWCDAVDFSDKQEGDFVLYTDKEYVMNHAALVIGTDRYESKLGSVDILAKHSLWKISKEWGNQCFFYRLKQDIKPCDIIENIKKWRNYTAKDGWNRAYHDNVVGFITKPPASFKFGDLALVHRHFKANMCLPINSRDEKGNTYLMLATKAGNEIVVETLVRYGALINERNNRGKTAYYIAEKKQHTVIRDYLLQNGADKNMQKYQKNMALVS